MLKAGARIRLCVMAGVIITSCGGPLGPAPFAWEVKALIPAEYLTFGLAAVGPKGLYCTVGTKRGFKQLVTFDGSRFRIDYQTPSPDDFITSVRFSGNAGFLGLARRTYPDGYDAALLFFDGRRWRVILEAPEYKDFTVLDTYGENTSLLLCTRESDSEVDIGVYSKGSLNIKGVLRGNFAGYSNGNKFLYAYNRSEPQSRDIFVSSDTGASWHREAIELPPQYPLKRIISANASADALYLVARMEAGGLEYYAIIKRAGEPGKGVFGLSYIGWIGPGVRQIDRCAFRDAFHGVAVGLGTSMFYEAPLWFRETTAELQTFDDLLADGRGGYWALSGRALLWHP